MRFWERRSVGGLYRERRKSRNDKGISSGVLDLEKVSLEKERVPEGVRV